MKLPEVVSPAEWQAARERLLVKEKDASRARDALAAERRRLPLVRFDKDYVFEGRDGPATLLDLSPLGRQEDWEDSPEGYPQTPRYAWWRLHDEYDD